MLYVFVCLFTDLFIFIWVLGNVSFIFPKSQHILLIHKNTIMMLNHPNDDNNDGEPIHL